MDWQAYQEEAAGFFRSIGLNATTNAQISGVRTTHDIDVLLKSRHAGFEITWIVECKRWKTRVSKMHVLALREIVADTGADRGILLAECGFQRGAIEAAALTNVRVTSLSALRVSATHEVSAMRLREAYDRIDLCDEQYWALPKETRIDYGLRPPAPASGYSATFVVESVKDVLNQALRGAYPVENETHYGRAEPSLALTATTPEELLAKVSPLIADLEDRLEACMKDLARQRAPSGG